MFPPFLSFGKTFGYFGETLVKHLVKHLPHFDPFCTDLRFIVILSQFLKTSVYSAFSAFSHIFYCGAGGSRGTKMGTHYFRVV